MSPGPPKAGAPYDISSSLAYDKLSPTHRSFVLSVSTKTEPSTFQEAIQTPEWREVMAKEIDALELNNTWSVCSLPPNKTPIDCK